MPEENKSQSTQLSLTMQAVLLLLIVIIGLQIWYTLEMKKQLDALQAEYILLQPLAQKAGEKNVDAVETINTAVFAENNTVPVEQDQVTQEIPPVNKNTAPAIPPALANDSPFNSPYYAQTRDAYEDFRRMQRYKEKTFNNRQNNYNKPDFQYHFSQELSVPEMDVREDNRQYIVLVNIPGADARNLSVKLEGQRLSVRGKQMQQKQDRSANGNVVFSQRSSGSFQRSITLHAAVEEKGMKTRIDNGVLTIIIPKKK